MVVFFRMVCNEKIFRSPSIKCQISSEGPTWKDLFSFCSQKNVSELSKQQYPWRLKLNLLELVWTLFGLEIKVGAMPPYTNRPPVTTPKNMFFIITKHERGN